MISNEGSIIFGLSFKVQLNGLNDKSEAILICVENRPLHLIMEIYVNHVTLLSNHVTLTN